MIVRSFFIRELTTRSSSNAALFLRSSTKCSVKSSIRIRSLSSYSTSSSSLKTYLETSSDIHASSAHTPYHLKYRSFSTTSAPPPTLKNKKDNQDSDTIRKDNSNSNKNNNNNNNSNNKNEIIIYKRHNKRSFFPRALLGASSAHVGYWLWYILDFTPAVNTSGMELLYVDPKMGYLGFALSACMLGAASLYPKYLIEEIAFDSITKQTNIKCFTLPFVTPQGPSQGLTLKSHEKVKMDADPKKLDNLAQHQIFPVGHVPISVSNQKGYLLLDIDHAIEKNEIRDDGNLQAFLMGWGLSSSHRRETNKSVDNDLDTDKNDFDNRKRIGMKKRILRRRQ